MHNELLKIGPFTVYGYGLMIAIGIFSAYCLAEYRARKIGLDEERVFGMTLWAVIGGILGGKNPVFYHDSASDLRGSEPFYTGIYWRALSSTAR